MRSFASGWPAHGIRDALLDKLAMESKIVDAEFDSVRAENDEVNVEIKDLLAERDGIVAEYHAISVEMDETYRFNRNDKSKVIDLITRTENLNTRVNAFAARVRALPGKQKAIKDESIAVDAKRYLIMKKQKEIGLAIAHNNELLSLVNESLAAMRTNRNSIDLLILKYRRSVQVYKVIAELETRLHIILI